MLILIQPDTIFQTCLHQTVFLLSLAGFIWPDYPAMQSLSLDERILSIDIGGSRIKAAILDRDGAMTTDFHRTATPASPDPGNVIQAILDLTRTFDEYHRV